MNYKEVLKCLKMPNYVSNDFYSMLFARSIGGGTSKKVVYGIRIDPDVADPYTCVTYLEDAVGMTPASMGTTAFDYGSWAGAFFMPRPCMLNFDGTVAYYLDSTDYTKKEDGTASDVGNPDFDGNAMMEWPLIWFKYEAGETEGEYSFYVSNSRVDNSYWCPCNINSDNQIVEHFYTAIYNGTSAAAYSTSSTYAVGAHVTYSGAEYRCTTAVETGEEWDSNKWIQVSSKPRLRSLSGIQLTSANGNGNTTGAQEVERALANNTTATVEWYTDVWADRVLINGLLTLMSKSLNSQASFGRGMDSGSQAAKEAYVTGALNDKGLFYGVTANGNSAVKIFGMENWWGCVWRRTAGFVGTSTGGYAYKMTYNNADGSTATSYNSNGSGYLTAQLAGGTAISRPASGYVTKMAVGEQGGWFPLATGGNSFTYYCDYYYTGTGYLLAGGGSGSGVACGCWYLHLSFAFDYSNWHFAAAPSCKPLKI